MIRSYLIDTHVLIWWLSGDGRLSRKTVTLLEDRQNDILIASPCLHEYAIKEARGDMPFTVQELAGAVNDLGVSVLPFDWQAMQFYRQIALPHKDPFDRAIAAQAIASKVPLITGDKNIQSANHPGLHLINP